LHPTVRTAISLDTTFDDGHVNDHHHRKKDRESEEEEGDRKTCVILQIPVN